MSDDVTITVRVNNQTAAGFRDVNGQLRTLDGRFAATGSSVRRSTSLMDRAMVDLKSTLISLAPAAVPVAASLAPIALHAGAAGLAVGAFGAALKPQLTNLGDVTKAQDKYTQAVAKYGQYSSQAVQAQALVTDTLKGMPAATQRAAMAYSSLRDEFKGFSDSTAKFTMVPVEHSFAVLGQLIPKLTPMVKGASTELDRFVTVAGGSVNTSGFDALSKKVSTFANSSLKSATDRAVHFMRVLSEGNMHGPLTSFFEYARAQGPAVEQLLSNVAKAAGNLLQGAAQAGPGLLTLVNAFAKLVAAVPPSLVGHLMQVYTAFKLIKLAGAGIATVGDSFRTLGTRIAALRAASVAAGGGLAGLKAAFATLGATAKASVVVGGLALLALGIKKLADGARGAPPDVDKLTASLKRLADSGKFSGELKKTFGDVDGLVGKIKQLNTETEKSQPVFGFRVPGLDDLADSIAGAIKGKDSLQSLKGDFDSLDKAMAGMASGGYGKQAAKDFDLIKVAAEKQGYSLKEINKLFPQYTSVVADAKWEQEQTAKSMGLFGDAALAAQSKLDAQKASTDGLRQSIVALNDVNRAGLGGMIGFEAAIDAAAKAARVNAGALTMHNGVLDLNSAKAQAAATALQDLADKTDAAGTSQRAANASWETVNGIYSRGRSELIKQARAMGLTKEQAQALASQLLKIPTDVKSKVSMNAEDAKRDINSFNAAVKKTPGSKSVTLKALSKSGEQVLEAFGLKVKRLPDGSVKVTTKGGALSAISNIAAALRNLNGKTATTYVVTSYQQIRNKGYSGNSATGGHADGGLITGPGSGTSDSIPAMLSNGEFVVNAQATGRHRQLLEAINSGQVQRFAKGGLSQAAKDARGQLSGSFGISSFGRMAGYRRTPFEHNLGAPTDVNALVSSLNEAAGRIRAAFSGKTESSLLRHLNSVGRSLIKYEKQLTSVTASLGKARDKLNTLKDAASQLSSSVKSNLIGSANITKGASGEGTVTLASVKSGLVASRDKVTAFASALKQLKAKGFSKSIIQQVAEAGIDGGGLETAGALLQASASEVSTINQMQGQIETAAGAAGKTTADSVYAKAIKDQTAVVNKLTKQQEKLEKSMASLAKSMEKLISKALGHKAAGGIVGAAASGGLRSNLTWVGEQGPELLDLPAGSRVWSHPDSQRKAAAPWASMLNTPRRGPSYGAAHAPAGTGHGGPPLVIQLEIGGRSFGELWVDTGRREVRAHGGIDATLRPPRGR